VAAWLTLPANGKDAVLITVPGSTYSHSYWDFPYKPEIYSFVQAMTKKGYSILNIDRLGTGESSKPKADITDDVQCFVVHQLVEGLRSGSIGGHAYKKIFLVGHSLGSCVIIEEQATYSDADGLIITGLLHSQSFPGQGVASLAPLMENSASSDDPIFKGVPYSAYTTVPGERGHAFYNLTQVDPQVLAVDEQTRTFTPVAENSVFLSVGLSDQIKVPVFIAVGEVDRLFSSPPDKLTTDVVRSGESQYFPLSPDLSFFVLPGSGHDINLHYDAQQWYDAAKAWLARQTS
jgi:pimeloyl-ACP methyl ester carboxylesterase